MSTAAAMPAALAAPAVPAARPTDRATGQLHARHALLPDGWARNVLLTWDAQGRWTGVTPGLEPPAGVPRAGGLVLPGMPNLHSHAFQRGMAGLTEYRAAAQDSFWSWRELMYRFAARLDPAALEAIAFALYVDMLEAGYTGVCEFHYVHHDLDGRPYADDAELSHALLRAAGRAGLGLTLLPVLYQTSGFGGAAATAGQRRFLRSTESMLRLLEALRPACEAAGARLGLAPHSLRAVPPPALRDVLAGLAAQDPTAPLHVHIAEQQREVDDCLAWCGQRPVAWLLDHVDVDARWCLVHATHLDDDERRRASAAGAVAGLCPTTEANLGDGLFDLPGWTAHGPGAWGIGSDSHICVDAAEELMGLEYGQRLQRQQRNIAATSAQPQVATAMWLEAVRGGAQASGRPLGGLAAGQQADLVMLDATHPLLDGLNDPAEIASAWVFGAGRQRPIAEVWVAGERRVVAGRHPLRAEAGAGFVQARRRMLEGGR